MTHTPSAVEARKCCKICTGVFDTPPCNQTTDCPCHSPLSARERLENEVCEIVGDKFGGGDVTDEMVNFSHSIMSALDTFIIEHDTELLERMAKECEPDSRMSYSLRSYFHGAHDAWKEAANLIRSHIPKV